MILLNRRIDYAMLILCYLHHNPTGGCAREIAGRFGLSRAFVANILKDLCQKKCVVSHRGVKGGYVLCAETLRLSLADLIDALDDDVRLTECNDVHPESCCSLAAQCPIRGPIEEVHHRLRAVLEQVTLLELFRQRPAEEPVQFVMVGCGKVSESN